MCNKVIPKSSEGNLSLFPLQYKLADTLSTETRKRNQSSLAKAKAKQTKPN